MHALFAQYTVQAVLITSIMDKLNAILAGQVQLLIKIIRNASLHATHPNIMTGIPILANHAMSVPSFIQVKTNAKLALLDALNAATILRSNK